MKHSGAQRAVVAIVAIAFLCVVAAAVSVAVGSYAGRLRDRQAEIARTAPRLYAYARPRYATPEQTGEAILPQLEAEGWRVRIHAPGTSEGPFGGPAGPEGSPGEGPPGNGRPTTLGAFAAMLGVTPRHVALSDATLDIVPDLDRFAGALQIAAVAILVALAAGTLALWRFAQTVGASALEPVVQTTHALRQLAAHDFTPRMIVTDDRSAIGDLARAYNAAAETVALAIRERDAAEAEMQRFLADAGHELRTPVTIVMGYLEILRGMEPGSETAERVVNGMRSEMARMRTLIEKLIVLSRLESTPPASASVDVVGVVAGVRESLSALAGGRKIDIHAPGDAYVAGDENDLHEAVFNLVENALKYAPDSDVRVTVQAAGAAIRIEVADRGPGMDAVDLRRAFERFYRGAGRAGTDGSGLGLAIVKRAVERCGGTVTAASTPGTGARFTIDLPRPNVALGAPA